MKKVFLFAVVMVLLAALCCSACGESAEGEGSHVLVVYFSRTGENYGVGVIEKGNTAIVGDMIAEKTGADVFEIVPVTAYPEAYNDVLPIAQEEQDTNARPAYQGDVESWENYDTVFLGYPIWWGDMPMIVYTFMESHDWTGKTVIPFDTNAGSGLSGTPGSVREATGATVLEALAVTGTQAQNDPEAVREKVTAWLEKLGYLSK